MEDFLYLSGCQGDESPTRTQFMLKDLYLLAICASYPMGGPQTALYE